MKDQYKMRFWILSFTLVINLMGCQPSAPERVSIQKPPVALSIQNAGGVSVGYGVHIDRDTFVTPDHLWVDHGKLYWQGIELEIKLRDFGYDLLFFQLDPPLNFDHRFSDTPPQLGKRLYWLEGNDQKSTTVEAISGSFNLKDHHQTKKDLLVLGGTIELGKSGTPLFDEEGLIFGIVIAADRTEGVFYALRSDIILQLLKETQE